MSCRQIGLTLAAALNAFSAPVRVAARLVIGASLVLVHVNSAQARQVTGGYPEDSQNQGFLDPMCRRWMPVMRRLMKTPWPQSADQFELVTAKLQPLWVRTPPNAYRSVLVAWIDQQLTDYAPPHKFDRRTLRNLVDKHLRAGRITIWRTRVPMPFMDWPSKYPRYREVTRIRFQPIQRLFPTPPEKHALYGQAFYYIISQRRPSPVDVGPHSDNPAFLFLHKGIPLFLRPVYNQVTWAYEPFPHSLDNPLQYGGIVLSFGCDPHRYSVAR